MPLSPRRVLALLTLALGGVAAPAASAAEALVINANADFVQINLASGAVAASWQLGKVRGVGDLVPQGSLDGPRVEAATYDDVRRTLFLALPVEARVDELGRKHFQIVALALPGFEILGTWQLPGPSPTPPTIVFRTSPLQLLVQYEEDAAGAVDDAYRVHLAMLEVPSLRPIGILEANVPRDPRQRSPETAIPQLSADALEVSENLFFDDGQLVRLRAGSFEGRWTQPLSALGAADQALLAQVAPPLPQTGRLPVASRVVAQAAGRALVRVQPVRPEDGDQFLYFLYDPASNGTAAAFLAPRSIAGLVDGQIVLLEYADTATTGRLEIRRASTGERLDGLESPLLAGAAPELAGILCGTEDRILLRGAGGVLLLADLESREVVAASTSFVADSWTRCFIAGGDGS